MKEKDIDQESNEKDKLQMSKKKILIITLLSVLFISILIKKIGIIFSEEDLSYKKESIQNIGSNKLINQITGKYIVNDTKDDIIITYFKKDKIINYIFNEEFPIDDILDKKENKDTIFYKVKSSYYDEIIYHTYTIKVLDDKIKYIYEDGSESMEYRLLNKNQVTKEINKIHEEKRNNKKILDELEQWLDIKKEDIDKI
ncbi:hypothetical protein [Clostridium sp. CCUG 7971]|uniref:hypothetical protein n=1 Tax=Clostridium sp. CCUG 7971 TaxID=2811414 RepID=UPI001ABAA2DA|nr:hypothetical protein [Clostridium sp. CCUG 7971]MBO3446232.1 hypothetical protein [Clostridium sp. CCUG 7971]